VNIEYEERFIKDDILYGTFFCCVEVYMLLGLRYIQVQSKSL